MFIVSINVYINIDDETRKIENYISIFYIDNVKNNLELELGSWRTKRSLNR